MRHLAFRDHSRFELKTKLERNYPTELVEQVLEQAAASGLLAREEDVAERMVEALSRRFKSASHIAEQLRARRLPVPVLAPEAEITSVRQLIERKFGMSPLSLEEQNKARRFLAYRGFQEYAIEQVLNEKR